jgi:hypothetical protein
MRWFAGLVLVLASYPTLLSAQLSPAQQVVTIPRGQSSLVVHHTVVQRVSIGDPEVAVATWDRELARAA